MRWRRIWIPVWIVLGLATSAAAQDAAWSSRLGATIDQSTGDSTQPITNLLPGKKAFFEYGPSEIENTRALNVGSAAYFNATLVPDTTATSGGVATGGLWCGPQPSYDANLFRRMPVDAATTHVMAAGTPSIYYGTCPEGFVAWRGETNPGTGEIARITLEAK